MSAATDTVGSARPHPRDVLVGWARRNTWMLGLLGLLVLLLVFTKAIQPSYGAPGIQGLAIAVLPIALVAAGQAIVVISGGIDLSVGSMMALTSVVSAALMAQSMELAIAIVLGVLVLGLVLGAINGGLVVVTRVPDIVVTLAMSFVWAGFALLVLKTPAGRPPTGSRRWSPARWSSSGSPGRPSCSSSSWPLIWIPIRRSRLGLSIYAIGSNRLAAFRSGVPVGRTKVVAYTLTGLFAALAGLSLTASTGIGTPVPGGYTLLSVAAIVLGGVSLAGGRGGVFGPIVAVIILQLIRTDMTFLNVNTNLAIVTQGAILIGVVMFGSLIQMRRARA